MEKGNNVGELTLPVRQRSSTTISRSCIPQHISVYSSFEDDKLQLGGSSSNNNIINYGSTTACTTGPMNVTDKVGSSCSSINDGDGGGGLSTMAGVVSATDTDATVSLGNTVVVSTDDDDDVDDEEAQQPLYHDNLDSNRHNNNNNNNNKLSLMGLAIVIFYNVSGGPFGVEASVRSGGNFYALLGFLLFPMIWSAQESLMTAELASTFPEASGGVAWVEEAFGFRAGFMAGYLGWVAGATDNAIYPVLFLDYLLEVVGGGSSSVEQQEDDDTGSMHALTRWMLLSITAAVLAYVNWRGLRVVETMSFGICFIAMSPFIIMIIVGSFQIEPSRWFEMPTIPASQDNATVVGDDDYVLGGEAGGSALLLRPLLNNLFWNLNSFDSAASYSGDVQGDPGKVLPRALGWGFLLTALGYFVPLLVAIGATDSQQQDWVDGYLAKAASDIAGPWLGAWTVLAAGVSNIALFQAELSADAFQLMGMADRGHVPAIFSTRSRHGTPTYGIILGTAVIIIMSVSDLDDLIEMLNFNYAISLIMEYFAFFKLRTSRPDLHRPYRIPLNTCWCIVLFAPTLFFTFAVLCLASFKTYLFSIGANAFGLLLYAIMSTRTQEEGGNSQPAQFGLSQLCLKKKYTRVDTDNSSTILTTPSANEDASTDCPSECSTTPPHTMAMQPAAHPIVEAGASAGGSAARNTII